MAINKTIHLLEVFEILLIKIGRVYRSLLLILFWLQPVTIARNLSIVFDNYYLYFEFVLLKI